MNDKQPLDAAVRGNILTAVTIAPRHGPNCCVHLYNYPTNHTILAKSDCVEPRV
jgi:hypothetical protein